VPVRSPLADEIVALRRRLADIAQLKKQLDTQLMILREGSRRQRERLVNARVRRQGHTPQPTVLSVYRKTRRKKTA